MEWNIIHSKNDCIFTNRYAGKSYCSNPKAADGTACDEDTCPIKAPHTNKLNSFGEHIRKLAKEVKKWPDFKQRSL